MLRRGTRDEKKKKPTIESSRFGLLDHGQLLQHVFRSHVGQLKRQPVAAEAVGTMGAGMTMDRDYEDNL